MNTVTDVPQRFPGFRQGSPHAIAGSPSALAPQGQHEPVTPLRWPWRRADPHALTVAHADNLLRMGHISPHHHAVIHAASAAGMRAAMAQQAPQAKPFGSFAPLPNANSDEAAAGRLAAATPYAGDVLRRRGQQPSQAKPFGSFSPNYAPLRQSPGGYEQNLPHEEEGVSPPAPPVVAPEAPVETMGDFFDPETNRKAAYNKPWLYAGVPGLGRVSGLLSRLVSSAPKTTAGGLAVGGVLATPTTTAQSDEATSLPLKMPEGTPKHTGPRAGHLDQLYLNTLPPKLPDAIQKQVDEILAQAKAREEKPLPIPTDLQKERDDLYATSYLRTTSTEKARELRDRADKKLDEFRQKNNIEYPANLRNRATELVRQHQPEAADLQQAKEVYDKARKEDDALKLRLEESMPWIPETLNTVVGPLGAMAIGGRVWDRRGHASSMQNLNRQAEEAYQTWRGIAKKDRSDALHEADRLRQFGPQLEQAHRGVYGGDDWTRFIPHPLGLVGAAGWNAEMRGLPRQIDYMRLPEGTDAKEEAGKWTPFAGGIDPSDPRTYLGRKFEPQNYAGQAGLGALWGILGHEAPVTSPFSPDRTAPRVMPNLRSVTGKPTYQKRWSHLPPWQ